MIEYLERFAGSMDPIISSLFTKSMERISSIDPEVAMAVAIVVCSTALTMSVNRIAETNDDHQESSPADLNDSFGPEGTETYCGSYGSEASSSGSSADQELNRLTNEIEFIPVEVQMTDATYDEADSASSSPKQERKRIMKTPSFKKLLTKIKNKQAARKEAWILNQSRAAVMKNFQRKSFSDHVRSLNPLVKRGRKKNLLTKSKSCTFASLSAMDDQSLAEKSV